jgi:spore maturation protein CgeB
LGVNRYDSYAYPFSKPDTYSRLRDIEAPMMGACYLTEWAEGLDQLYDLGEEIETYRTAEEMVEKIRELTANPEKRKRMRCYGQKRALSEHTVAKSLDKISAALNLKSNPLV